MLPLISLKSFLQFSSLAKRDKNKAQRFLRYLSYPGKTFKKGFKKGLFVFFCLYSIDIKSNTRDYCWCQFSLPRQRMSLNKKFDEI